MAELNKENLLKCELIGQEKVLLQVIPVLLMKHSIIIGVFNLGKSREVDRGFASKWNGFKVSEIYIRVINDNIHCSQW